MADRATMTVRRTADPNLAALNEMLAQRSGLFLVSVHNYRIQKVARVEKERKIEEIAGYDREERRVGRDSPADA